jgi:hypothetical protein
LVTILRARISQKPTAAEATENNSPIVAPVLVEALIVSANCRWL